MNTEIEKYNAYHLPKKLYGGSETYQKYVSTVFVTTYPRYISVGWFEPIIDMSLTMDVSMYFYPIPSGIVLKQLKKKIKSSFRSSIRGSVSLKISKRLSLPHLSK